MKYNLPTQEQILLFTQEIVENLPIVSDLNNILPVDTFARIKYGLRNKSRLVYIIKNEKSRDNIQICYVECNVFNGVLSDSYWCKEYVKSKYATGEDCWKDISTNLYEIN